MEPKMQDLLDRDVPAAPPEQTLARRFVGLMLEDAGKRPLVMQLQSSIGRSSFGGDFDDEETDAIDAAIPEDVVTLSVNVAAAAILLADRFETDPALLRDLRKGAPVVVVHVPDEAMAGPLEAALRICALGRSVQIVPARILEGDSAGSEVFDRRTAVIAHFTDDRRRRPETNARAMRALSLEAPFLALSTDPMRAVPDFARALSDATIVFGAWRNTSLEVLVEAVTGDPVSVAPDTWLASVTLDDLRSSVSRSRGGTRSVDRLRRTVQQRLAVAGSAPLLEDLAGYGAAREIGLSIIEDLESYAAGRLAWSAIDPGLLLAGPPGTGKTLFAKSFARSAGLPLVVGSLSEWQSSGTGHLGDLTAAMRKTFASARELAPAVLFIDELDGFGDRQTFDPRHRDYSSQVVNCLLEQLDGAQARDGVVVIAATNLVERIDPAIRRAGRLDRVVQITLPGPQDMAAILRTQLGTELAGRDLMPVALAGRGSTGADASSWVRRARGKARREGREVGIEDLMEAVTAGKPQLSGADTMRVSVHESGHAVAIAALGVGSVSEIALHADGGITRMTDSSRSTTRMEAVALMTMYLSGREAERTILGSISAGAGGSGSSDLAMATRVAFSYECSWGLGELGPIWTGEFAELPQNAMFSPSMAPVRALLLHAEAQAARLVGEHRTVIERCAERLRSSGYLDAAAAADAIGPIGIFDLRPPPRAVSRDATPA